MFQNQHYVGLSADAQGGMGPIGQIIRDAWVFGLLAETEDCKGWTMQGLDALYDQVSKAWAPYGHLPSCLPAALQQRHTQIYAAAMAQARILGWKPEQELEDET